MHRLLALAALVLGAPAYADEPTIDDLLNATDDIARGESSVATMKMHVKTKRYERTVEMQAKTAGTEKSLIVITAPAKEKGVATLKVGDDIWNYLPKIDRTVKVPSSMMGGSWMGSHFTNDDLVKENRLADEFDATITARPEQPGGNYVVELVPKPDAPVVWGKVTVTVRDDLIPMKVEYFDEDNELSRTMTFEDVKEMDGRTMPGRMRVVPADKPDEFTEFTYEAIDFDVDIPEETFSLQGLRSK